MWSWRLSLPHIISSNNHIYMNNISYKPPWCFYPRNFTSGLWLHIFRRLFRPVHRTFAPALSNRNYIEIISRYLNNINANRASRILGKNSDIPHVLTFWPITSVSCSVFLQFRQRKLKCHLIQSVLIVFCSCYCCWWHQFQWLRDNYHSSTGSKWIG